MTSCLQTSGHVTIDSLVPPSWFILSLCHRSMGQVATKRQQWNLINRFCCESEAGTLFDKRATELLEDLSEEPLEDMDMDSTSP